MYIKDGEIKSYSALKNLYQNLSFPKDQPPDGWQIYTPPAPTLEEVKQRKKSEINEERNRRETAGFLYQGKMFDGDQRSADRIQVASLAAQASINAGAPFSVTWSVMDNSTVVLDAAGVLGMVSAFAGHGEAIFEQGKALKAQVDACATVEEVNAITWGE